MKKLKYPYETASNGLEAFEAYAAEPDRFCCILMGTSMYLLPIISQHELTMR